MNKQTDTSKKISKQTNTNKTKKQTQNQTNKHKQHKKNKAIARDAEKQIAFFAGLLTLKSIGHGSHSLAVLKAEITLNVIQSKVMADLATIFKLWALEVLQTILLPVFQLTVDLAYL